MQIWHFTEMPYPHLPPLDTLSQTAVTLPNSYFDPKVGAELYNRYLDEYVITDELGFNIKEEKPPLAEAVRKLCSDTATALGLADREIVAPGYKADLNVIDYDRLCLRSPEMVADLPTGGWRLLQRADGYVATILSGEVTYRDGVATNAFPGRLIRGAQSTPC